MNFKKIVFVLVFVLLLSSGVSLAANNSIDEIFVDVEILDDGTGIVTQTWNTNINEGTELFIPMEHLNHMELVNFTVSDENGPYEYVKNWDSSKSFEDKKNQYGILNTPNGIELVFGVSEYGNNTYNLKYSFNNMVQSFSDKDGFNVRFINDKMNPSPNKIAFRIYKEGVELSPENANIWSFGYGGNIEFSNGEIIGQSTSPFTEENYLNVMVSLDKGIVHPVFMGNDTFESLKEFAFQGSDYDSGETVVDAPRQEMPVKQSSPIQFILPFIAIIIFIVPIIKIVSGLSTKINNYDEVQSLIGKRTFSREIPFDGKIAPTYYFLTLDPKYDEENSGLRLLFAYLMKWFLNKNISENYEFLKEPSSFVGLSDDELEKNTEYNLWNFLLKGEEESLDGLFAEGFEDYMEENYLEFHEILQGAKKEGYNYALKNGYVETTTKFGIFKSRSLTELGIQEMSNIQSNKDYINSLGDNFGKENTEEDKDLLVLATLLGLNPELKVELDEEDSFEFEEGYQPIPSYYPLYIFYNNTRMMGYHAGTGIRKGVESYNANSSSGSSGFGGGASFGGGGGFSGGGSGGGVR